MTPWYQVYLSSQKPILIQDKEAPQYTLIHIIYCMLQTWWPMYHKVYQLGIFVTIYLNYMTAQNELKFCNNIYSL